MKRTLRIVAFLEGTSFLLLLGVGMPLKYGYGMPLPTRILGSLHGMLFLGFLACAYDVATEEGWSSKQKLHAFAASILPLGTFWFDARYLRPSAPKAMGASR
jgi:integral membrane protein